MIYNLCNIFSDQNLDTFHQISIIEATQLPDFNHLDPKLDILAILNSLPDHFQAMRVPFLPEKTRIQSQTKIRNQNRNYATDLKFPVLPQDSALKDLLETYNNKLVVALVKRNTQSHLYGTSAQPLTFVYDELHANNHQGMKGFDISLDGEGYGAPIYFSQAEIGTEPVIDGLAFQLAGTL